MRLRMTGHACAPSTSRLLAARTEIVGARCRCGHFPGAERKAAPFGKLLPATGQRRTANGPLPARCGHSDIAGRVSRFPVRGKHSRVGVSR